MAASGATWVASPELYPTEIRATGHAICNAVARIGALLSPYVVMSSLGIPTVATVLCITSMLAGLAAKLTPETAGADLDTTGVKTHFVSRENDEGVRSSSIDTDQGVREPSTAVL